MVLAALNEWQIFQTDFIAAYLSGDLKETINMQQFPYLKEFFDVNSELRKILGNTEESITELRKPLYGLKQSETC